MNSFYRFFERTRVERKAAAHLHVYKQLSMIAALTVCVNECSIECVEFQVLFFVVFVVFAWQTENVIFGSSETGRIRVFAWLLILHQNIIEIMVCNQPPPSSNSNAR